MEDLLNIVGNIAFPIAVAGFLLIRIESKIICLTQAIGELREATLTIPREQTVAYQQVRSVIKDVV
ncbi:MAG: YvrJ family protein [Desulfitobacteriaceae bacterium]|nr:YvrJ family protein [Desulfitobacteriaceae bacterium]